MCRTLWQASGTKTKPDQQSEADRDAIRRKYKLREERMGNNGGLCIWSGCRRYDGKAGTF